jgi:hypothetical protein
MGCPPPTGRSAIWKDCAMSLQQTALREYLEGQLNKIEDEIGAEQGGSAEHVYWTVIRAAVEGLAALEAGEVPAIFRPAKAR